LSDFDAEFSRLAATGIDGVAGVKSSDYGVFSRGPKGHKLNEPPETE
jgi:hypothetical protein